MAVRRMPSTLSGQRLRVLSVNGNRYDKVGYYVSDKFFVCTRFNIAELHKGTDAVSEGIKPIVTKRHARPALSENKTYVFDSRPWQGKQIYCFRLARGIYAKLTRQCITDDRRCAVNHRAAGGADPRCRHQLASHNAYARKYPFMARPERLGK